MIASTARIVSSRVVRANVVPRVVTAVGSTRTFAISDTYNAKVSQINPPNISCHVGSHSVHFETIHMIIMSMYTNHGYAIETANSDTKFYATISHFFSHVYSSLAIMFQEKVEEDRYIRAREGELADAKAKAAAATQKAEELAAKSAELIATKTAAMTTVANMLAVTGDVVSEAGLANLADWKHSS